MFASVRLLCLLWLGSLALRADDWPPAVWTQAAEPFHLVGPVYYVGGRELSAYLVADEAGLILVNVGMAENVPLVLASIRKLGFDPANLRYLLITQAHMDHAGGAALLQHRFGVEVLVGKADVALMHSGGLNDHVFGDDLPFTSVAEVRGLVHGERITLGSLSLDTVATPGHTPGGSSWLFSFEEKGVRTTVLFQGSVSVLQDAVLKNNPRYPKVVADFELTLKRLEALSADWFLPDHVQFVHPKGVTHKDPIEASWFQNPEILSHQLNRARKALARKKE